MQIILVAATEAEILPTLEFLKKNFLLESGAFKIHVNLWLKTIISGVGPASAALAIGLLNTAPDTLVLHAGVAGSYDENLPLGSLVEIERERWGDLGAEDRDGSLIDVFSLGLLNPDSFPYDRGWIKNDSAPFTKLPIRDGVTVSRASGYQPTINSISHKFPLAVESMEGAGIFLACRIKHIPFLSVRAISNWVKPRDKSSWKMGLALENLNNFLIQLISDPVDLHLKMRSSK